MRLAVAQLNTYAGDFDVTKARMLAYSRNAAEQRVDLLVFPLSTLTGAQPVDFANREAYLGDLAHVLVELSDEVACPCLVTVAGDYDTVGFPDAVLLDGGEVTPVRRYDPEQTGGVASGLSPASFEVAGKTMGLAFTYVDIDAYIDARMSLDVLVFASAYGYALDDASSAMGSALAESRFAADAVALDAWVVGAGSLGGGEWGVGVGSSFVLSPTGQLAGSAPAFEEALLVVDLEANENGDLPEPQEYEIYNRSLFLWEALTLSLRDHLQRRGIADVALAFDASLASCVLVVLATDAVGPRHVHVAIDSSLKQELPDALWNLPSAVHANVEVYDVAKMASSLGVDTSHNDLMALCLSGLAQQIHALTLDACDKTHLALEATAPCLRAASLLPLGDVYRTDIIELAHLRNTISPVIPQSAFLRVAVPQIEGLDDAESTLSMRLQRLDVTIATCVEWERSLTDVVARRGNPQLSSAIVQRLWDCAFARSSYPPHLVVSSRPLSELRFPLQTAWRDHVRKQGDATGNSAGDAGEGIDRRVAALLSSPKEKRAADESGLVPSSEDFTSFLEGLGAELVGGALPPGVSEIELQGALGDLLGLLQDMAPQMGGDSGPGGPHSDGPLGPLTWGSPFSEN